MSSLIQMQFNVIEKVLIEAYGIDFLQAGVKIHSVWNLPYEYDVAFSFCGNQYYGQLFVYKDYIRMKLSLDTDIFEEIWGNIYCDMFEPLKKAIEKEYSGLIPEK